MKFSPHPCPGISSLTFMSTTTATMIATITMTKLHLLCNSAHASPLVLSRVQPEGSRLSVSVWKLLAGLYLHRTWLNPHFIVGHEFWTWK